MKINLRVVVLVSYLVSLMNFGFVPVPVFAQEAACPIPHSHQQGTECVCDAFYKPSGSTCVAMTASEICPLPNSHQSGSECVCDQYFKPESGACVAMSSSEICPVPNTHREGDQCFCDTGFLSVNGSCLDKNAVCATHHATFDSSINDCSCIEGYAENDAHNDCVPVEKTAGETQVSGGGTATGGTTSGSLRDSSSGATQISGSGVGEGSLTGSSQQNALPPVAPVPPAVAPVFHLLTPPTATDTTASRVDTQTSSGNSDPAEISLLLMADPSLKFSNEPLINATLRAATPEEMLVADKQQQMIGETVLSTIGSDDLPLTANEKFNLAKSVVTAQVAEQEKKWNEQLAQAEKDGKVKDPADQSIYLSLQNQENSLLQQVQNNQDMTDVIRKQNMQIMFNDQPFAPAMWSKDKKFVDAPKRDFMKESQGDMTEAKTRSIQAIVDQTKLLAKLKDDLRKVRGEKQKLLDVPPKPNLDDELKKVKVDWYK